MNFVAVLNRGYGGRLYSSVQEGRMLQWSECEMMRSQKTAAVGEQQKALSQTY